MSYARFSRVNCDTFCTKSIRKYKKIVNNSKSLNKKPPKSTKKYSFEGNSYNVCLRKPKSRTISLFTKNTQIKILLEISDISKVRGIIYGTGIHDLKTRTVSFPDQRKLLKKVDGG